MRKFLRYAFQYAILGVVALAVYQTTFRRGAPPAEDRAAWSQRDGFVAISYGGLTMEERENALVTKARLREHLTALAKAGFRTVATADLRDFYNADKPLPEKALYVMFEGGRKDSVLFSQPVLQETGFHASLYLFGGHLTGWNRFFVRADELGKIARSPFWDVDSMGYHAEDPAAAGKTAAFHYLAALQTGPDGKSVETQQEFEARAAEDFRLAYRSIDEAAGVPPLGYVFVPANTLGVSLPAALADPLEKDLKATFPVAFTRVGEAYNSRENDPHALTRLAVAPDWTAERLLLEIDSRLPRSRYLDFSDSVRQGLWQVAAGDVAADGQRLTLTAPAGVDPFARLRGSEGFEDFLCQVKVDPQPGGASLVYLRYRGPGSFVRLQITQDRVVVQEKNGSSLNTILQYVLPLEHDGPVSLDGCVKANRLLLSVDGKSACPYPIPLTADTSRGYFALGALSDKEQQPTSFTDLRLTTFAPRWVQLPTVRDAALDEARTLTGMILPATNLASDPVGDAAALVAVSAAGVGVYLDMPEADAAKVMETVAFVEKAPAAMVFAKLLRGLVLSLDNFPDLAALSPCIKNLRAKGFAVVLRLSQAEAARLAAGPLLTPDWLLFDVAPAEDAPDMATLRNRYDRARMLFRLPAPPEATAVSYEVKR
ncbi:hypothetical protein [Solidesulfovibrio sp.]|uniref:hypothetical protein n=1 Tax=Solidesulfovibrio sp. TaxID=2910990 RepID=UPI002617E555|nr:hypothetical protein [Solidesulfovibrio sp.]